MCTVAVIIIVKFTLIYSISRPESTRMHTWVRWKEKVTDNPEQNRGMKL